MHARAPRSLVIPALCAALLLTACGGQTDADPSPTDSDTPSATPTATVEGDAGPEWPSLAAVDASAVEGLNTYVVSDNERQLHIVVPQLDGHDRFNDELRRTADEQARTYIEDTVFDPGGVSEPSFVGTWSATAISPEIVGFSLEEIDSPGASTGTTRQVVWYDPQAGELRPPRELLTDAALPEIVDASVQALQDADIDVDADAVESILTEADPTLGFTADGGLLIAFDSHTVAAGAAGAPAVALPDPSGQGWLSDIGTAALEATLNPTPAEVPAVPQVPARADVDCSVERCVALTFDDGPAPRTTSRLLDILATEQVSATFFVLGSQASAFPELIAREVAEGHEVANHTWRHPNLPSLSDAQIREELASTSDLLADITGTRPTLMRPPYGATGANVAAVAKELGMAQVLWNIDTLDWQHHIAARTTAAVSGAPDGSIVLLHDIHSTTVDAVPGVISTLRAEGFTFVTVSDLLGETTPGERYFQAR